MDEFMKKQLTFHPVIQKETGQSIVIIAVVMVALLAFVGLAIDLGLVWARRAQLTAAVDAAALAGVGLRAGAPLLGAWARSLAHQDQNFKWRLTHSHCEIH